MRATIADQRAVLQQLQAEVQRCRSQIFDDKLAEQEALRNSMDITTKNNQNSAENNTNKPTKTIEATVTGPKHSNYINNDSSTSAHSLNALLNSEADNVTSRNANLRECYNSSDSDSEYYSNTHKHNHHDHANTKMSGNLKLQRVAEVVDNTDDASIAGVSVCFDESHFCFEPDSNSFVVS